MTDRLFLIEILIQEIVCDNKEIDKSKVCVDVKLGQIANFAIQLNEKPDIFNIALVNPGKSYLFPASPYVLKHQLPQSKIYFNIKKESLLNNKNVYNTNDFQVLGTTSMEWPISFRKLIEYVEKNHKVPPETINEQLFFKDEGYGHFGHMKIFMRFSCIGHDIQTSYQVVQTKDEAMSYLFKGSKIPAPFKTEEYGQGGRKDLLPVGPLYINEECFKKPSCYSLDLTNSEIESQLCDKEDCLAAIKFKEYGIGPLSKKKKEIISPCGGEICPYAHEIDDPPCTGHRKCKLYTPQRPTSSIIDPCIHLDEMSDENRKPTSPPIDQSLFKPYIITPRKYNPYSINQYKQESIHSTDRKFSQIISVDQTKHSNQHECKIRCTVPKRSPSCNNGHLRAGGDENGCCQRKCTVTTQSPETLACGGGNIQCRHKPKPCSCNPLGQIGTCNTKTPTCGMTAFGKPPCKPPSCGTPSCRSHSCKTPSCGSSPCGSSPCRSAPCGTKLCGLSINPYPYAETCCVSPTICEDCGGYSRSGKTCKDIKKEFKKETEDYHLRVENLKCFCKPTTNLRFRKECSDIETTNNKISTQIEPNILQNKSNNSLRTTVSIDSTTTGKTIHRSTIKTISRKSKYNQNIENTNSNYEMKPPFERLKSGGELPVGGESDNPTAFDNLVRDMKRRKHALVYDIGNNYPGNRVGHKTCILKVPQCPSKKGWEWSPEPALPPFKPRKEYKPGFIPKEVQESINLAREYHGLTVMNPVGAPKKKKRRGKTGSRIATATADDEDEGDDEYEVEEKNTLTFQRKDGTYFLKMNPLRDPLTVKDNEDPYIYCPPIEFTYTKDPLKKMMLGENTCDCCTCEEDEKIDNDELNIDFSPPMGVIEMERMKKAPNVVHFWTQYDETDFDAVELKVQKKKTR